jgi:hypothetical protein
VVVWLSVYGLVGQVLNPTLEFYIFAVLECMNSYNISIHIFYEFNGLNR